VIKGCPWRGNVPAKVQISGRSWLGADRTATAVASAKGERLESDSSVPGGTVKFCTDGRISVHQLNPGVGGGAVPRNL